MEGEDCSTHGMVFTDLINTTLLWRTGKAQDFKTIHKMSIMTQCKVVIEYLELEQRKKDAFCYLGNKVNIVIDLARKIL